MKKIIIWNELNADQRRRIFQKTDFLSDRAIEQTVRSIMDDVRRDGDKALRRYALKFDRFDPDPILLNPEAIEISQTRIDAPLRQAIEKAYANIQSFHEQQGYRSYAVETQPGVTCERRAAPVEKVGFYVPAGTAPLFSTVLMLGVPSQIAGNPLRMMCTPCSTTGEIHPAVLYAAKLCGVTQIARVGGSQAIAAMAYGTESIPAVGKIFGPGNAYVTQAKILAASTPNGPAIDMPAGPSEVLVIIDEKTPTHYAAADLLAQAEHDAMAGIVLVGPNEAKIDAVLEETRRQLDLLPRKAIAGAAIENGLAIVAESKTQAMMLSNLYAPEHLILCFEDYEQYLDQVMNAGSVFCGLLTPESFGDYASGTNHALPTGRAARAYSGLTVEAFQKTITVQRATRGGFGALADTVVTMARAEGLEAHARAVTIRKEGI